MAGERRKCFMTLGLHDGASEAEIKKAYKKLALQYHPDKNESDDAKSKFQEIGYAYKYLTEGPSAFGTTDPHDVREEMLRRMFEEMFFARFRGPFGGFPFFCEESDEDDYYINSDSSDDCYCGSCHTKESQGRNARSYQHSYPRTQPAPQYYPQPSKKQLRKKEKRQRQKERAKEQKAQQKQGRQPSKNLYTDDVNPEPKKDDTEKPAPKDDSSTKSKDKSDTESSRPDTPLLNQQPQKMNKKQKKKMESEQRKREKEMEEIAAELMKKQEREMEKQREKERLAAQKKEEEKENEMSFSHFFDNGKKSRKAKQREKRRQESDSNKEPVPQRENSSSFVREGKPLYDLNTNNHSSSIGKDRSGVSMNKNTGTKSNFKKPSSHVNRFDVLDNIDDDFSRPMSGSSLSSADSLKNSHAPRGRSGSTSGASQNSGYTTQPTGIGFTKQHSGSTSSVREQNKVNSPNHEKTFSGHSSSFEEKKQFKSRTYQNTNRNRKNLDSANLQTNGDPGTRNKTSIVTDESEDKGYRIGKKLGNDRKMQSPKESSNHSDNKKNGLNEFEEGVEREFVQDWSVYYSDEEDNLDDLDLGYGAKKNASYQKGSQYNGQNSSRDNFGYDSPYRPQTAPYQPRGYPPQRREFIPRTRGFHGCDDGPYYGLPPEFPPHMRGPPPFPRGGMYPPPPNPHFRGGYPIRPSPRYRGGYQGPRYGPPMENTGYSYGRPDRSVQSGFSHYRGRGNNRNDYEKNIKRGSNKGNTKNDKKSCVSDSSHKQDENKEKISQSNGHLRNSAQSDFDGRVPSPSLHENEADASSPFANNIFSNIQDSGAGSGGSFDSLDDFTVYETGSGSTDNRTARESREGTPQSRSSTYSAVDMGLDEFLSKDNLGVPAGMFSDSIKNYYK